MKRVRHRLRNWFRHGYRHACTVLYRTTHLYPQCGYHIRLALTIAIAIAILEEVGC